MPYQYNPHRHVKIWLSKNPNVFMNLENQVRLSEMRDTNPNDVISLVYDSTLLSETARAELAQYCKKNRLTPVDVSTFNQDEFSDQEKQLYAFYRDEVEHLDKGGNLAGASDIIRWLAPVYRLGSYTDLDVPVDTTALPESVEVESPLLVNLGTIKIGGNDIILANNDYVSVVDENAAKTEIEKIQAGILGKLSRYHSDFIEKTEAAIGSGGFLSRAIVRQIKRRSEAVYIVMSDELNKGKNLSSRQLRCFVQELMTDPEKYLAFKKEGRKESDVATIANLRKDLRKQLDLTKLLFFRNEYIKIYKILLEDDDEFVRQLMKRELSLYLTSIIVCSTGPVEIASSLFGQYVMNSKVFDRNVKHYSFKAYGLDKAFRSDNSVGIHENIIDIMRFLGADTGTLNDSSWLPDGISLQAIREADILDKKDGLTTSLPKALHEIRQQITKRIAELESKQSGLLHLNNQREITALKIILNSFSSNGDVFDIELFRRFAPRKKPNHHGVFSRFFQNRTEKIIEDLQVISRDAQVYGLSEDDQVKNINVIAAAPTKASVRKSYNALTSDEILKTLADRIAELEKLNQQPFDLTQKFIPALKSLEAEIRADIASSKHNKTSEKKISARKACLVAKETISMIDSLQELDLNDTNCNLQTKQCRMVKRIHTYDKRCYELTRASRFVRGVAMVIAAAVGFMAGVFVGGSIGYLLGAWSGPGALVTAMVGLLYGAYSGAAIGLALTATLASVTTVSVSNAAFFRPHPIRRPAHDVASSLFGSPAPKKLSSQLT